MIQRMCVYFSSNDISTDVTWEKVRQSIINHDNYIQD